MSNSYDKIATVDISIQQVLVDSASFDNILIVGPLPKAASKKAPAKVGAYSSINEVTDAGWVTTGDDADPVGIAARVAFSQDPAPTTIYIAPIQTSTNTTDAGATTTAEHAVMTVQRAVSTSGWYVVCPAGVEDSELTELAEYIETQEKMMLYTETKFFGAGDEGADKATIANTFLRTGGIYGRTSSDQADESLPTANKYINVAFAVAWLANESGSETAAFKTLRGVEPAELTTAESKALEDANLSYFTTVGNKNITMVGKAIGDEWLDIIRFRDWLKNDMQVRVCNVFVQRPKVPFTDEGIALIQNAMEASLKAGQEAGGIADDEYDEDGNVNMGYETSVPLSSQIDDSDKAARKLTGCTFRARLTGAIHFAELKGTLAYSL